MRTLPLLVLTFRGFLRPRRTSVGGRHLAHNAAVHRGAAPRVAAVSTINHFFFLFFPEAVTDHFTRPGPVFFDASFW